MKKIYSFVILIGFAVQFTAAQTKILFDATKAETAGNADWVIDSDVFNLGFSTGPAVVNGGDESNPQRFPTPAATLGQTYTETYWKGALSYWGLDCVAKGYSVETLPITGSITYGNGTNPQDLLNYKAFIICEPNIQFTAAEKTAILNFVAGGGGLFMISDHDVSDRNNDGWDSPQIWNDLMQVNSTGNTNPFGMIFNRSTTAALDNFSETSSNVNPALSLTDSILHGPMGNVAKVLWSNGTSMTISPAANSTVKAVIYKTSVSPATGNAGVMVAYAHYGLGKVIAIGDSSPCDDGTGDTNDNLFTGYMGDVPPNHRNLLMNGTIWLVTTLSVVPVQLVSFTAAEIPGAEKLDWITQNENNISGYQLQRSENGTDFYDIGAEFPPQNNAAQNMYSFTDGHLPESSAVYYRVKITDLSGNIHFSDIKMVVRPVITSTIRLQNNPVHTEAVLNVSSAMASQMNVQIFNMQGRQIGTYPFGLIKGKQDCRIAFPAVSPGVYLLKCTSASFSATLRVIKSE